MRRTVFYALFGLIAYGIALAATVPAGFAYMQYQQYGGQQAFPLELQGLSGTIWSGSAVQAVAWGRPLGRLEWSLSPWSLLLAKADIDWRLTSGEGYLQGNLALKTAGQVRLNETGGQLPIRQLTALAPFMPVVAEGTVSLRVDEVVIAEGVIEQAEGKIVWNQAALMAPAAMKLGDLSMAVSRDEGGALVGHVTDHGGPLQAGGTVTLQPDGRYNLDLQLAAQAGADEGLRSGLAMLGRADAQGRYRLKYQGKL